MAQDGFAILNAEDVVGGPQQIARAGAKRFRCSGPGSRKGAPCRKRFAQRGLQRRAIQQAGRRQQAVGVRRFRAKGQRITAKRRQQMHAGRGESFGPGASIRRRQCDDQVCPGLQRCAYTDRLRQQRYPAALHGAGAHADRNGVDAALAQHRQLGRMAVVEGIIFGDDADKIHTFPFRRPSAVQEAAPGGAFFPLYHSRASRLQTINKHKFFRHALCSLPEAGGQENQRTAFRTKNAPWQGEFS